MTDEPTLTGRLQGRVPIRVHLLDARDGEAILQLEWKGHREPSDHLQVGDSMVVQSVVDFNIKTQID